MRFNYILLPLLLLSFSILSAQDRMAHPDPSFEGRTIALPDLHATTPEHRDKSMAIKTLPAPIASSPKVIDTLNFPLQGQYTLYTYGGGYVSGNNSYDDRAKANVFAYGSPSLLTGVLIDFAVATSNTIDIEIAAWDNTGTGGKPGNKLASTTIPLDDIFLDVLNDQTTYVPFETPALMSSTFYVGIVLPPNADTVAIFTNVDGDPVQGTAWEQWSDGQWFPYDDQASWGFEMDHAIFPIVNSEVGLMANFFANPAKLMPGESTTFFDSSIGDPLSWEWTFEGGSPATSEEESPTVTYATEGLYDVTLVIDDGVNTDTLTREDYILVAVDIPIETDTLNYPLEGLYTLYSISDGGGYICGNNLFNDLAKANYFAAGVDIKVTGMLVDFAVATGGNPAIEMHIWNNNGSGGVPGNSLATATVDMNTIKSNLANNMMTYVSFDTPVSLDHPFYAGFMLPTEAGDTLAVWSNEDGDTFPGTAWDLWEDGNWVALSDAASWGMNMAMAIHPVVEYQTGIATSSKTGLLTVRPNPSAGNVTIGLKDMENAHSIELTDLQGSTLGSYPVHAGQESLKLDLSRFPAGIYFLKMTGDPAAGMQKIILH